VCGKNRPRVSIRIFSILVRDKGRGKGVENQKEEEASIEREKERGFQW
jgi:hypothetical protein